MAWDPPLTTEIAVGKAVTNPLMTKIRDSLMYLYGTVSGVASSGVNNGNFEIDSDGDGVPDGWSFTDNHATTYPGGTVALETTSPLEGAASIKMVHPGGASNGGGLVESDYIPCATNTGFFVGFLHSASAAGMKNKVIVYWYDVDQVALGGGAASKTIYSSTNNPASPTYYCCYASPPSGAKFCTVALVGGYTDTAVAGTAYFDAVTLSPLITGNRTGGNATIAEGSTSSSTTPTDTTSGLVNIPHRNCPITFFVNLGVKTSSAGNQATARLRVGSTYSTNVTSMSTNYGFEGGNPATVTIPADPYTAGADLTVYIQTSGTGGAYTSYGIVSSQTVKSRIPADSLNL